MVLAQVDGLIPIIKYYFPHSIRFFSREFWEGLQFFRKRLKGSALRSIGGRPEKFYGFSNGVLLRYP